MANKMTPLEAAQLAKLTKEAELYGVKAVAAEADTVSKEKAVAALKSAVSAKIWKNIWDRISNIFKALWDVLKYILRDLSPYIALIIVILLIIGTSMRRPRPTYNNGRRNPPRLTFWDKWFTPSYNVRSMLRMFSGSPPSASRPKEIYGRCDNVEWQHTGGNGSGLCVKTYKPETISWTFDTDKMPELNKIPSKLYDSMNYSSKMQVFIPWAEEGTFFVPKCSGAYFKELDENGNEKKTPAGYLFDDKGLICQRVEKNSKQYGTAYRPKTSDNLYDFASEGNPKCDA
jgi:hypothetical protein